MRGVPGRSGRTVTAVVLALDDATAQLVQQISTSGSARPFGGLRAGSAALERGRRGGLRLRGYGYVPGVRVSGLIPARGAHFTLAVGGPAAAHGRLTFSRRGVTGVLGGVPVHVGARVLAGRASTAGWVAPAASAGPGRLAAAGRAQVLDGPSPLRNPPLGSSLSAPAGR